jgi:tetratricopeptide (TPR) repeat protein
MTDSAAAYIALVEGLIDRALATSPRLLQARFARGEVLRTQGRYKKAIPDYETVLALNRNWVNALYALGQCKLMAGWIEEAIPLVEQAIHLSPRDPFIALWYLWIGRVHLVQSSTDEAILWLEKARSANPELAGPSRLPHVRLCPEKRYRTRRPRACRSPAAEQRRSFLEHCPFGK